MKNTIQLSILFFTVLILFFNCRSDENNDKIKSKKEGNGIVLEEKKTKLKRDRKPLKVEKKLAKKVKNIPSELEIGAFKNPDRNFPKLVEYLEKKAKNDVEKVKLFHDWIADNIVYDVKAYYADVIPDQSYQAVLKTRKSVCEGNSNLLKKMCDLAGIENERVPGYSRGYGTRIFENPDYSESNHIWNAVKIDGEWQLVDVTWDSGYIENGKFNKKYSTNYLFIDPQQMLYTHFPADPKWQLTDQKVEADFVSKLPDLKGNFFNYDLELVDKIGKVTNVNGTYILKVKTPEKVYLSANVLDKNGTKLPNTTFVQKIGALSYVHFVFPDKGEMRGRLYVRNEEEEVFISCANFGFINANKNKEYFPKVFETFYDLDCQLKTPLKAPLKPGSEERFEIIAPNIEKASLVINEEWFDLEKEGKNTFVLNKKIPKTNVVRLFVAKKKKDTNFKGILEWKTK